MPDTPLPRQKIKPLTSRNHAISSSYDTQNTPKVGVPAQAFHLVNRDFTAVKPGQKMVGDITYIPTWQGWLYLALVIDCATMKIVGWAIDDNYKTPLITDAIEMAARNLNLPEGAVFHSDREATTRLPSPLTRYGNSA